MQTYKSLAEKPAREFKRLTGVKHSTFLVMVDAIKPFIFKRQKKGGPRFTWSIEDMLLMTLTYWREYRTYFHIAGDYNLCESQCFRTIKIIESALLQDQRFHLKGKHTLLNKKDEHRYSIIDVSESPIERPQKKGEKTSKNTTILAKRSVIPLKHN